MNPQKTSPKRDLLAAVTILVLLAEPLNALVLRASKAVGVVCPASKTLGFFYLPNPKPSEQPAKKGSLLQYSSSLMPSLQASHLASTAWQQLLSGGVVYFSQPGVPRKFCGFFLQYCSSLMPCLQASHLASTAWQQMYCSQPPKDGFFLQYSSSLMPSAQERHLALYAWQQIGGPGCSILKA